MAKRTGLCWMLAATMTVATATSAPPLSPEEPDEPDLFVLLGEDDLADRAEIRRNMYRRITPVDFPLVQDVGTWPAAWEEFGTAWTAAPAFREYGAWVRPVEVAQDAGMTVVKDGAGAVIWRGRTDFARPESAGVVLTGGLVTEEEWEVYEGVREAVNRLETAGGPPALPVRTGATNGLRFTAHEWTTNDTFRLELAYETDTNVDIFACAVAHTSAWVVATWTNDENVAVTDTNLVWFPAGPPFNGMESDWEHRGMVALDNGVAEFEDSGFPETHGRVRFYAASLAQDSDGDGLNDGVEAFVAHTDPNDNDSDNDGIDDATEFEAGTNPSASNVWWVVVTTNEFFRQFPRPDCLCNAPSNHVADFPVDGVPIATNSVVDNVTVSGFVDDAIMVDSNGVDFVRNVQTFDHRCITNEIANLQSRHFVLALWDYPRADYEGPNEAKIGDSETNKFRVEWTWMVPLEMRFEPIWATDLPPP